MNNVVAQEFSCKICGNKSGNKSFIAKEMAYGMRDEFQYIECHACECLQIAEIPANLSDYYPQDYYSFVARKGRFNPFKILKYLFRIAAQGNFKTIFKRAQRMFKSPSYAEWLKSGIVRRDSRVLDVGCGTGALLFQMEKAGFKNLSGIDPFIPADIFHEPAVHIYKNDIFGMAGRFDFIMLHHSFEHMEDPYRALSRLHELLADDGYLLIRIPVAGSYAWKKYLTHWVSLEAPRHLFLHTPRSMEIVSDKTGFSIERVKFDSTEYQFWGSEQYLQDIPMWSPTSYEVNPAGSIFSEEQIDNYAKLARELNTKQEGDSAGFLLRKKRVH